MCSENYSQTKDMYDKILLRKRSVMETINDELKNVAQFVHSRHRIVFNFVMNVLSVLAAYSFFPDFVIVSPKNLRQIVWRFSDALPSALFGYKPPCSKVA